MLSQTSSPSKDCEYIVDMFSKDSRTLHKPLILLLFMLLLLLRGSFRRMTGLRDGSVSTCGIGTCSAFNFGRDNHDGKDIKSYFFFTQIDTYYSSTSD